MKRKMNCSIVRIVRLFDCTRLVRCAFALALCAVGLSAFAEEDPVYGYGLRKVKPYLYEIWYDNYEDSDLTGYDAPFLDLESQYHGGCSSVRVGNYHGRNLDIGISDTATIVVHMKAGEGRFASVGTSQWGDASETALQAGSVSDHRFDVLPNWMTDGINEKGVAINVNVIPLDVVQEGADPDSDERPALHARKVVRYVLDHAESAQDAIDKLSGSRIYGNIGTGNYNLHWMISDAKQTFVVEVIKGQVVAREHPIMTNFHLNWDNENKKAIDDPASWGPDKYTSPAQWSGNPEEILNLYTRHAEGIERYIRLRDADYATKGATFEGMFELMREAQFTKIAELDLDKTFLSDLPELDELEAAGITSLTDVYASTNAERLAGVWETLQPKMQEVYANLADHRKPGEITKYSITTHNVTFDLAEKMFRIVVQEEYDDPIDIHLVSKVSGLSNAFALDIAAGDRIAQPTETIVVDPAWGAASVARVVLAGNWTRMYTCATNDLWDTTALEPGRYGLALFEDGWDPNDLYGATFWKTGDNWEVLDGSNITANTTFEADKTYLILGTNTVAQGVELTVEDGVKFEYGAGAGFKGGAPEELPRRYRRDPAEGDFYQIVEKIKGSADNPWVIGNDGETPSPHEVEAYTNGNELVIGGKGTISDLSEIATEIKTGTKKLTITEATVTGAEEDVFEGVGGENAVEVSLPDNWQGELPDENGALYGMTVDMSKFVYPKSVRNVKFQQRYPWNGLVDVTCDLSGAGTATLSVTVLTNGVKLVANPTITGETTIDLGAGGAMEGVRLIWNAAEDLPAGFKAQNVKVKVTVEK